MLNLSFSFWLLTLVNSIISMVSSFPPTQQLIAFIATPAFQNAITTVALLSAAYVFYRALPYVRRALQITMFTIGSLALLSLSRAVYLVLPHWTSEARHCAINLLKRLDTVVLDFAEQGVALVQPSLVSSASGDPVIQNEATSTFIWISVFGITAMALVYVIHAANRTISSK